MEREEEALRFQKNNVREKEVCEHLVTILTDKNDYNHALLVLKKAIKLSEFYESWKWLRKEIEIYEMLGSADNVIKAYRRLFVDSAEDFDCYEALKKSIPSSEWNSYLKDLMDETAFSPYCLGNTNFKAEILIAENDYHGLFEYLCVIDDCCKLSIYESYALRLFEVNQINLIPYYMNANRIEAAEAKKRDHYSYVCRHISYFKKLNGSEQSVASLVEELRSEYRRRPTFIEELKSVQ